MDLKGEGLRRRVGKRKGSWRKRAETGGERVKIKGEG